MAFIYNAPSKGTWNPETHTYSGSTGTGSWTWKGKTDDKVAPVITVTNHSNVGVKAALVFTSQIENLTGSFTNLTDGVLTLASAEGTERDNAPKAETSFSVSGGNITEDTGLGSITITVTNVKAPPEETLNKMLRYAEEGGTVVLTQDTLKLTTEIIKNNLTIDLNHHDLFCGSIFINKPSNRYLVRIIDGTYTIKNGTLRSGMDDSAYMVYACENSDLTLVNCTLTPESSGMALSIYEGKVLLKDCTVNSGVLQHDGADQHAIFVHTNSSLTMSGTVNINCKPGVKAIEIDDDCTVTCLEGTYNFDPKDYVDETSYIITQNTEAGTWTVAAKTS